VRTRCPPSVKKGGKEMNDEKKSPESNPKKSKEIGHEIKLNPICGLKKAHAFSFIPLYACPMSWRRRRRARLGF
jgi:hypothetical protein